MEPQPLEFQKLLFHFWIGSSVSLLRAVCHLSARYVIIGCDPQAPVAERPIALPPERQRSARCTRGVCAASDCRQRLYAGRENERG